MTASSYDYKTTLNLPQTEFPMKADLAKREPKILEQWQRLQLYQQLRQQGQGRPIFVLHDGPPYANGPIHLGTAVNKTLKDIIVKAKTFSGFNVAFVPGWDCHGLPIELYVEKKLGKPGVKVSPKEFRAACREFASSQVELQSQAFQRLGIIADWQHPYLTMDFKIEADIVRALAKIMTQGNVERGYRPVHWCLDCASSLAEAEVEYADKTSPAIDVLFKVVDINDFISRSRDRLPNPAILTKVAIPIWTTTPWTLPANEAVALNPALDYALVATKKYGQLLIAHALVAGVMARYRLRDYQVLAILPGAVFEYLLLQHPCYERQVPVILGAHVTVDAGTGAVHTAPAHGYDDFIVAKQYNLPLNNPIAANGCFVPATPLFAGLHVLKANPHIINELQKQGNLLNQETTIHSYPHCWRHKTPVIFRATPQWFISLDINNLRARALAAISTVQWLPAWGEARITHMIAQRGDWCISRQRTWGVPIALFIHKETGALHPQTLELMEQVAQKIAVAGIEAWQQLNLQDLLGADAANYQQCCDTLDVWFDSGVSHDVVLGSTPELAYPADLYLEGSDQHRGWFNSSLLTAVAITGRAPYKTVLTHGYVVDLEGKKMSKSVGNVLDPHDVINSLGADILRLWVAAIDYRAEIHASHEIFKRTAETYRRLRNTARFLLANIYDFVPAQHLLPPEQLLALDYWAVSQARLTQQEIIQAYDAYKFHVVYQKLHNFCVTDMGSFYLDIIKDRQYTMPKDSKARRSAQTAMYHILHAMTRWLAPILSFTAEEIWQNLPASSASASVFLNTWYQELPLLPVQPAMNQDYWEVIRQVRDAVNKEIEVQRHAGQFGSSLEAEVSIYCNGAILEALQALGAELCFVLITAVAQVLPLAQKPSDAVNTNLAPAVWLSITATSCNKCERCWHRVASVGNNCDHPNLCARCISNVLGDGELRQYA